jgi:hypothetical protein
LPLITPGRETRELINTPTASVTNSTRASDPSMLQMKKDIVTIAVFCKAKTTAIMAITNANRMNIFI